nr:MAG TPA: hypothetical protein [Caudoviricetes sp.]
MHILFKFTHYINVAVFHLLLSFLYPTCRTVDV